MKLSFTYSFSQELHEAAHMLTRPWEYRDLRSVIWPWPWHLYRVAAASKNYKDYTEKVWNGARLKIEQSFYNLGIKDLGNVTCYVHGISCEGWFDTDAHAIHVRVTEVENDAELLDSIVHELLHLVTYDEKLSYEERENLVNRYSSRLDLVK